MYSGLLFFYCALFIHKPQVYRLLHNKSNLKWVSLRKHSIMTREKKLDLISLLLTLVAIVMIVLGYLVHMPAPALTGFGFLLLVWALQVLK